MGKTNRLYSIWYHMNGRCYNENFVAYEYYGGRGIKVCEEWRESFASFERWARENGYTPSLEIDRRDGNGDYSPDNCRWATRVQQMQNTGKRKNARTSEFKGVSWCANVFKWRVQLSDHGKPIHCGLFLDEVSAARHYDRCAVKYFGEFASLNFPGETIKSEFRQLTLCFA